MDIKEFAQTLLETTKESAEMNGVNFEEELATTIIEYIADTGEVNAPEICSFKKQGARLTAYDYNDEAESLDLFYFEQADTLIGKINNGRVQQGFNYLSRFFHEAVAGTLLKNAKEDTNCEIAEVAELIQSAKDNISQLRIYYLTDGLTDPSAIPSAVESEEDNCVIEFNVWDMQRIYQQQNIRAGKEKIEIDFPATYNTELQCLKISAPNPFIEAYLAIIPGKTLAKIYKHYQQVLLEKNVRTFLQFKGRVNKDIRRTLRDKPDMFFSYNNGISTTASEVRVKYVDGVPYITQILDWQIVNGGQTTAAIAASLSDGEVDINKVYVPMKISVIHDKDHSEEIIKAISTSANSQTAIKNSDFSANEPFLVDLENLSRTTWVPNGNNKPICKWYFERTRGQYFDQLAQLSGFNEKSFRIEYPKSHKITKTDIAKYDTAWKQHPYDVCRGAENNYKLYVAEIKRNKPIVTAAYYKKIIAEGILFNTIDSIVQSKSLGGYKANMNAYLMAAISSLSNENLDMTYIWDNQKVQQAVIDKIEALIPLVWRHLTEASTGNQMQNVGEWSKKIDCWYSLKLKLADVEKFGEELLQKETNEDGSSLNEAQRSKIDEAESYSPQFWYALAAWAKSHGLLTPIDRKSAFNFGSMRDNGRGFASLKQAMNALRIISAAREQGFDK